jgi:hypothetical protein
MGFIFLFSLLSTGVFSFRAYEHYQKAKQEEYAANARLEKRKFYYNLIVAILPLILNLFFQIYLENYKINLKPEPKPKSNAPIEKTPESLEAGTPHPQYLNVMASKIKGEWIPEPGYKILHPGTNDLTAIWEPDQQHPDYSNVIASKTEKIWIPRNGYKFIINNDKCDLRVRPKQLPNENSYESWEPGNPHPKYPNVMASKTKVQWISEPGYKILHPGTNDLTAIWEPGQQHPDYPNVIASKTEKIWIPRNGYKFIINNDKCDLRVRPKQ